MDRRFMLIVKDHVGHAGYYDHMMRCLAEGLDANGVAASILRFEPRTSEADYRRMVDDINRFRPTDTFAINWPRPPVDTPVVGGMPVMKILGKDGQPVSEYHVDHWRLPIPDNALHHRWVQDIHPLFEAAARRETPGPTKLWSWVKRWTTSEMSGLNATWLPPATDYYKYQPMPGEGEPGQLADVGFAGIVFPGLGMDILGPHGAPFIEAIVLKLTNGARRFRAESSWVQELIKHGVDSAGVPDRLVKEHKAGLEQFVRSTIMRFVQRTTVIGWTHDICQRRGWKLALAGKCWENHYPKESVGWVQPGGAMAAFFRGCKVNLQINGDTNVHQRTMEVLASGGFCLSERLGDDQFDLEPLFSRSYQPARWQEPSLGVVPTFNGTQDSLESALSYWLDGNPEWRQQRINEGKNIVICNHNWESRANQIIQATAR